VAIALVLIVLIGAAVATVLNGYHLSLGAGTAGRTSTPSAATTTLRVVPTTSATPPPEPTPYTSLAAAVFTDPAMAAFARGFFGNITDCKTLPLDPQKSYSGVDLSDGAVTPIACRGSAPDAPGSAPFAFVGFTKFTSLALAKAAMYCGLEADPGSPSPPPGMNGQVVKLPGSSGSKAGYYCEYAQEDVSNPGQFVGFTIGITWTDAIQPIVGHIDFGLPGPTAQYPGSVWTALRGYWNAHA
jgi:hypothetical protein